MICKLLVQSWVLSGCNCILSISVMVPQVLLWKTYCVSVSLLVKCSCWSCSPCTFRLMSVTAEAGSWDTVKAAGRNCQSSCSGVVIQWMVGKLLCRTGDLCSAQSQRPRYLNTCRCVYMTKSPRHYSSSDVQYTTHGVTKPAGASSAERCRSLLTPAVVLWVLSCQVFY
jgi:hypothetical protein